MALGRWMMGGLLLASLGLSGPLRAEPATQATPTPEAKTAPLFTLKDLKGKSRSLKAEQGKVVLVNFWATWCGPCRYELPKLQEIYGKLKAENVTFFVVSVDDAETVSKVKPFVTEKKFEFPILLDTDAGVVSKYNEDGIIPFTVIIDHQGKIRHVHSGYNPGDEVVVEQELRTLLKALPPKSSGKAGK